MAKMSKVITFKTFLQFTLSIVVFLSAASAFADTCDSLHIPGKEIQYANCLKVVELGLVPDARALQYTIWFWVQNQNHLADPSCAIAGIDPNDINENFKNPQWIAKGFTNACSFVVNDLNEQWADEPKEG